MSEYLDFEGLQYYHNMSNSKQLDSAQIISEAINNLGTTLSQNNGGRTNLSDFIADSLRDSNGVDVLQIRDEKLLYKSSEVATLDNISEQDKVTIQQINDVVNVQIESGNSVSLIPIISSSTTSIDVSKVAPTWSALNTSLTNVFKKSTYTYKGEQYPALMETTNKFAIVNSSHPTYGPAILLNNNGIEFYSGNYSTDQKVTYKGYEIATKADTTSNFVFEDSENVVLSSARASSEKKGIELWSNKGIELYSIKDTKLLSVGDIKLVSTKVYFSESKNVGIYTKEDELWQEKTESGLKNPISHPNLSTQPSILPQRFGTYPIYEVLCPFDNTKGAFDTSIIPSNANIIGGSVFGGNNCESLKMINGVVQFSISDVEFALVRYYLTSNNGNSYYNNYYNEETQQYDNLYWRYVQTSKYVLVDEYGHKIGIDNGGYFFKDGTDLYVLGWDYDYPQWSDSTLTKDIKHIDSPVYEIIMKGGNKYVFDVALDTITPNVNDFTERAYWTYIGGGLYLLCNSKGEIILNNSNGKVITKKDGIINYENLDNLSGLNTISTDFYSPTYNIYNITVGNTHYTIDTSLHTITPTVYDL